MLSRRDFLTSIGEGILAAQIFPVLAETGGNAKKKPVISVTKSTSTIFYVAGILNQRIVCVLSSNA